MKIEQFNTDKRGSFRATEQEADAGRMTYTWAGSDKIIIDHTEVMPAFSGKGVGKQLVLAAVEYARENHIKILPLCPFARSIMEKEPTLQDVLF